jgi:hypothetical protein
MEEKHMAEQMPPPAGEPGQPQPPQPGQTEVVSPGDDFGVDPSGPGIDIPPGNIAPKQWGDDDASGPLIDVPPGNFPSADQAAVPPWKGFVYMIPTAPGDVRDEPFPGGIPQPEPFPPGDPNAIDQEAGERDGPFPGGIPKPEPYAGEPPLPPNHAASAAGLIAFPPNTASDVPGETDQQHTLDNRLDPNAPYDPANPETGEYYVPPEIAFERVQDVQPVPGEGEVSFQPGGAHRVRAGYRQR